MMHIRNYFKKVLLRMDALSFSAFIAFLSLSVIAFCALTPLDGERELFSGIIRFHILANSDTEADQTLKLHVRDEVTKYTSSLLADCTDIDTAREILVENRSKIIEIANRCIEDNGFNYSSSIEIGKEIYPKRSYGKYTFPAGEYCSLRLKLGEASGQNWWCVLFPPMCLGAAVEERFDDTSELKKIGFSEDQINIISDKDDTKTEIRFFMLDFLNSLK